MRIGRAVAENQLELNRRHAGVMLRVDQIPFRKLQVFLFGQREVNLQRIDCGNGG